MPPVPRSQSADEVAGARVDAIVNPQLDAIRRAEEEAARRAYEAWQQQQQQIQGQAQAAAGMVAPIAGQIQGGYQQAAELTGAMGKAFSQGFQDAVNGTATDANALLAQQGSPQQVQSAGVPGSDVLYGLGGFIPGSTLAREGAAFGAAASMLPSTQLGYGSQRLGEGLRAFNTAAEERRREYENLRQDVLGTRAGLVDQERQRIFERNMTREQFAEEKRQNRANARLQWAAQRTQAEYLGVSKSRMLQEEAAFMTDMTGELHVIRNGRVVPTGKLAAGSEAAGAAASATGDAASAAADRAAARKAARGKKSDAILETAKTIKTQAKDWRGTPIENPKAGRFPGLGPPLLEDPKGMSGKFLTANGKSTNNPAKAARENFLSFAEAVNRAMASEEAQQLMSRYGMSRAKVRAKVVAWLRASGITPGPQRSRTRRRRDLGKPVRG